MQGDKRNEKYKKAHTWPNVCIADQVVLQVFLMVGMLTLVFRVCVPAFRVSTVDNEWFCMFFMYLCFQMVYDCVFSFLIFARVR